MVRASRRNRSVIEASGEVPAQHLDGDDAMEREVASEIHRPHRTATEQTHDLELVRELARHELGVEIAGLDDLLVVLSVVAGGCELICRVRHRSLHLLRTASTVTGRQRDRTTIPRKKVPCRCRLCGNAVQRNELRDDARTASGKPCSKMGRSEPQSTRTTLSQNTSQRAFLRAEWRDLVMLNYEVPENLLAPLVPAGVELDRWNGTLYVSVVGFLFRDTRVLGVPVPTARSR